MTDPGRLAATILDKSLLWITVGLVAYVSLIPYYYLPPLEVSAGGMTVPIAKYFPFLMSGSALLLCAVAYVVRRPTLKRSAIDLWILAHAAVGALSACLAEQQGLGLQKYVYFGITGYCLFFAISRFLHYSHVPLLAMALVLVSGLVAMYGVVEYVFERDILFGDIFEAHNPYHKGTVRVGSSLGNPSALGSYLLLCLPFSIWKYCVADHRRARAFYGLLSVAGAVCTVLTFSRGTWLGAMASALVFFAARRRVGGMRIVSETWMLGIVVLLTAYPVATSVLQHQGLEHLERRIENVVNYRLLSALSFPTTESYRLSQYRTTLAIVEDSPFLGIGFGNFTALFDKYRHSSTPPASVSDARTTENMYLMIASETGLVGLFVTAVVLWGLLNRPLRYYIERPQGSGRAMLLASTVGISGLCVHMLFWDALNAPTVRIVFWLVAGLTFRQIEILENDGREFRNPSSR